MKTLNLIAFGLLLTLSNITGQSGNIGKGPKLVFKTTSIDYGTVANNAEPYLIILTMLSLPVSPHLSR